MRVGTKPAVRARRRSFTLGVALVAGLAVFLTVSLLSAILFMVSPGGNSASASFIQAQTGSVPWNGKDRVTILLLGVSSGSGRSLPSTFTVASFDPADKTVSLLSIPPNLWVTTPGFGPGKLSESYVDGGPRLSLLMTETITHVAIPYFAVIPTDTLSQMVDALGGLKMSLPGAVRAAGLRSGPQELNGASALSFLRQRDPDPQSGVMTMHRQDQVLLALGRQLLNPQTFAQIPTMVNNLGGSIRTNFPYNQIQPMARLLLSTNSRTTTAVLSYANHAVTRYRQSNQDVLLPDWEQIRSIAQAMMPDRGLYRFAAVDVLNGSGQQGVAARLADWLRLAQVRIHHVGSAPSFNYAKSEVVVNKKASSGQQYVARQLAALLQMPLVTGSVGKGVAPDAVIIGQDFQDPSQQ